MSTTKLKLLCVHMIVKAYLIMYNAGESSPPNSFTKHLATNHTNLVCQDIKMAEAMEKFGAV